MAALPGWFWFTLAGALAGALEQQRDPATRGQVLLLEHSETLRSEAREDFKAQGETPTIRRVSTAGGVDTKQLFVLFPKKPAKKMAYIAGLPKPHGCV